MPYDVGVEVHEENVSRFGYKNLMPTVIDLFEALAGDRRLQQNWRKMQPRVDRAFEAPLIARTPREVATASLLATKLKFAPEANKYLNTNLNQEIRDFASRIGGPGTRLINVMECKESDEYAKAASLHSLQFYRDRTGANELVRLPWSSAALTVLVEASPEEVINSYLKPSGGVKRCGTCLSRLARLMFEEIDRNGSNALRIRLRSTEFPGLGFERADAVGVFGFEQPWPIVDEYLWRLLHRHRIITDDEASISNYNKRRKIFEPHWQTLIHARPETPNELAATLYLWADEAEKFGYFYDL